MSRTNCRNEVQDHPLFTEMIVPINVKYDKTTLEHLLLKDRTGTDQDHPSRCEACRVSAAKTRSRKIGEHTDVLCIMLQRNHFINAQKEQTG